MATNLTQKEKRDILNLYLCNKYSIAEIAGYMRRSVTTIRNVIKEYESNGQ